MDTPKKIVGYHVKFGNMFVEYSPKSGNYLVFDAPEPIEAADAFRRAAAFVERGAADVTRSLTAVGVADEGCLIPQVIPVEEQVTPVASASRELGSLLMSLAERHGVELGMTPEQVEAKIAQELVQFGAR